MSAGLINTVQISSVRAEDQSPISNDMSADPQTTTTTSVAAPIIGGAAAASSSVSATMIGTVSAGNGAAISTAQPRTDRSSCSSEELFRTAMLKKLDTVIKLTEALSDFCMTPSLAESKRNSANVVGMIESITKRLKNVSRNTSLMVQTLEDIGNLEGHYRTFKSLLNNTSNPSVATFLGIGRQEGDEAQMVRELAFLAEFESLSSEHSTAVIEKTGGGKKSSNQKSKKPISKKNRVLKAPKMMEEGGASVQIAVQQLPVREDEFKVFVNSVFSGTHPQDIEVSIAQRVRRWHNPNLTHKDVQDWKGYKTASSEQIMTQMKYHTFPGLVQVLRHSVLIEKFVKWSDSTSPFIVVGFQNTSESAFQFGKIQFGLDQIGQHKLNVMHMQFVELDDLKMKEFIEGGKDKTASMQKKTSSKKDLDVEVFKYVGNIEATIGEDGENSILLQFPNNPNAPYSLRLFSVV